jgi:hypothetical protein
MPARYRIATYYYKRAATTLNDLYEFYQCSSTQPCYGPLENGRVYYVYFVGSDPQTGIRYSVEVRWEQCGTFAEYVD